MLSDHYPAALDLLRERGGDGRPRAVAASVQDARVPVRALAPEGTACPLAVEADPVPFEVPDTAWRAFHEDARHRLVNEPGARRDRVLQVLFRGVVRAYRGRDAALGVARAALMQLPLRDEEHGTQRARFKRGEEARHAAPDHDRPVPAIRPWGIAHGT